MRFLCASRGVLFFALLLLVPAAVVEAAAPERSYWIGSERNEPFTPAEMQEFDAQHVSTIFWQVGEVTARGSSFFWKSSPAEITATNQRIIPVVRITAGVPEPFKNATTLIARLLQVATARNVSDPTTPGPLVIDFACPERLLADYTAFLTDLRGFVPELYATATADTVLLPGFPELQQSVRELEVRFSDDAVSPTQPPLDPAKPFVAPALDEALLTRQLAAWGKSKGRWRAIIPNRAVVMKYDSAGTFVNVLHGWSWDTLFLDPALKPISPMVEGSAVFKLQQAANLPITGPDASMAPGDMITCAASDRRAMARAAEGAQKLGAAGIIFSLPEPLRDETGWSLRQLRNLGETEARIVVRGMGNRLVVTNPSASDLPMRCETAEDRGYAIELLAPDRGWTEIHSGDFYSAIGYYEPTAQDRDEARSAQDLIAPNHYVRPKVVPLAQARRVQFQFGMVRAGQSITSGLVRFLPTQSWATVRYRILPIQMEWQSMQ